jgi:hypothetical protein
MWNGAELCLLFVVLNADQTGYSKTAFAIWAKKARFSAIYAETVVTGSAKIPKTLQEGSCNLEGSPKPRLHIGLPLLVLTAK